MTFRSDAPSLTTHDVELAEALEALELSNRRYRSLFELAPVGYLLLDAEGQVEEVNHAAAGLLGQPHALIEGIHVKLLARHEDRALLAEHLDAVREGRAHSAEIRVLHADGRHVPVSVRSMAITAPDGAVVGMQMAMMDISTHKDTETELRRAKDYLHHLAHHDALTDLPNRLLFGDRLRQALLRARRRRSRVALLFIDFDRFKFINDSLGHQVGDQFLCEMARRIRECVRAVDTVARIGGDEFTVILERIERDEDAEEVARKIMECLRVPIALASERIEVTCSIGVAMAPDHGEEIAELIRNADAAMFAAKQQGRDRIQIFNGELDQQVSTRVLVETQLRNVVSQEQLCLHYQPQFHGRDGRMVGVEALVRWNHPERGLLRPAEFIHVAEESGTILQLGAWVLREACSQGVRWHAAGHRLRVAVNVSPRQLAHASFVDTLDEALGETGFDPGSLEIEITEGALMQDLDSAIARLRRVRQLGVHVAIDDFGTGFSSLSRLRRLPISRVKIDGSFVQGIPENQDDEAIARAIISMAHDLSLEVISEGVETDAQRDFLARSGCDLLQGFRLGEPVPADEVSARLLNP